MCSKSTVAPASASSRAVIAVISASHVGSGSTLKRPSRPIAVITPPLHHHLVGDSGLLKYLVNGPASSRLRSKRAIVSAGWLSRPAVADPLVRLALVVVDDVTDRCPHGAVVAGAGAMHRQIVGTVAAQPFLHPQPQQLVGGRRRGVAVRRRWRYEIGHRESPFVDVAPAGPLALTTAVAAVTAAASGSNARVNGPAAGKAASHSAATTRRSYGADPTTSMRSPHSERS